MSADNGIYIAEFPTESGSAEYRVANVSGIDNCYMEWIDDCEEKTNNQDAYRSLYFGNCTVYSKLSDAQKEAKRLFNNTSMVEYGICVLQFDHPIKNMSYNNAMNVIGSNNES